MGRPISLIFLLLLAFAAARLPYALQSKVIIPEAATQEDETYEEEDSAWADDFSLDSLGARETDEEFEADYREIIGERPELEIQKNPLVDKLLKMGRSKARKREERKRRPFEWNVWFERQSGLLSRWSLGVPGVLNLAGLLFVLLGLKGQGRSCLSFCHFLASTWIFLLSIFAVFLFAVPHINAWAVLPNGVWSWPIVGILVSAALLRTLDMNAPVWNDTIKSFITPLAAFTIVLIWAQFSS